MSVVCPFRVTRNELHQEHFESRSCDEKTTSPEIGEKVATISEQRRRSRYRRNSKNLRRGAVQRCTIQNFTFKRPRLGGSSRTRDALEIWFREGRSTAVLSRAGRFNAFYRLGFAKVQRQRQPKAFLVNLLRWCVLFDNVSLFSQIFHAGEQRE